MSLTGCISDYILRISVMLSSHLQRLISPTLKLYHGMHSFYSIYRALAMGNIYRYQLAIS